MLLYFCESALLGSYIERREGRNNIGRGNSMERKVAWVFAGSALLMIDVL